MQAALFSSASFRTSLLFGRDLFRGRLERSEIAERNRRQRVRQGGEIGGYLREPRAAFAPPLVHIDRAVEFELDGVQSGCGLP